MHAAGRPLALVAIVLGLAASARADAHDEFIAGQQAAAQKQWAEAAQDFMRVTVELPGYAPAWKALASSRFYMGDTEGAVASADHYLDLAPQDSAFAHWANDLRRRLKLPPRSSPLAAATAAPASPPPTDDGILMAAPPPDGGAQAVGPEDAQALDAVAAQDAVAIDDTAQQDAAETMQADAARVRAATRAAQGGRMRAQVGIRVLGGWALGLGGFAYGESVQDPALPSGVAYDARPAQGGSGAVEGLLDAGPHFELSLGAYPLAWGDSSDSSATGAVTRSNSSRASGLLLPLMVSLGWRQALGRGWDLVLAGGAGLAPANRASVNSQTVQTTATGLTVTTASADYDYAAAPAWRAAAGAEWKASPTVSLYLGLQLLGADFATVQPSVGVQAVDATGAPVAVPANAMVPGPQALKILSLQFMGGLTLHY